jgi:thiamine biosynthesis lipoprotein
MEALESRLTRFRNDSELSHINQQTGKWIAVTKETFTILRLANEQFDLTNGVFNPFMGHVIQNLGYRVTFKDIHNQTQELFRIQYPYLPPMHSPLQLNEMTQEVRLDNGYMLDLGGIAKGWIVEQTADHLLNNGVSDFICNAGGDLVCKGTNNGQPWVVGITDPFNEDKHIFNLNVSNMCVATSGTYSRTWSKQGRKVHHIIDPFLGEPADTDIISCTVISPSLIEAEILAKAALILGTSAAQQLFDMNKQCDWIIVKISGEVEHSCN